MNAIDVTLPIPTCAAGQKPIDCIPAPAVIVTTKPAMIHMAAPLCDYPAVYGSAAPDIGIWIAVLFARMVCF